MSTRGRPATVRALILDHLAKGPARCKAIAEAIGKPPTSLMQAIYVAMRQGHVVRKSRGVYALPPLAFRAETSHNGATKPATNGHNGTRPVRADTDVVSLAQQVALLTTEVAAKSAELAAAKAALREAVS